MNFQTFKPTIIPIQYYWRLLCLKSFSLSKNRSNIFALIGLLLIFLSIFYVGTPLLLAGILIAWIPDIYKAIVEFKQSRKINTMLTSCSILFILLALILIIDYLII